MLETASFIATRRDNGVHTAEELAAFAQAVASGAIPDYQISAWLMAAFLNPLNLDETAALTMALAKSGDIMDLEGLPKPWVDKHSTGGVGDKTTIALLPILAACGLTVVKMSGRGLGITGGTIDKLSAIPGFRTDLGPSELKSQARRIGLALTGQSPNLAPADKVLYALRDTTGTVGSIPLIVSSVLSKKIAGGAETIVLDVKCGSGGLVQTEPEARKLATTLSEVGKRLDLNLRIALTDMSQPLGCALGNALEVQEAIDVVAGRPLNPEASRFRELCLDLSGLTLQACGIEPSRQAGRTRAEASIATGHAFEKMAEWFAAQGSTFDLQHDKLPRAPVIKEVKHTGPDGWFERVDAQTIGRNVMRLGGGRKRKEDTIDVRVGIELHCHVGARAEHGQTLFTIHATDEETADKVAGRVLEGISVSPQEVPPVPLILDLF